MDAEQWPAGRRPQQNNWRNSVSRGQISPCFTASSPLALSPRSSRKNFMANILIADGHPLGVLGMREFLGTVRDLLVLGEAKNVSQILETLARKKVDLIILEL